MYHPRFLALLPVVGTAPRTSPADVERHILATLRAAWESSSPPISQRGLATDSGVSQSQVSKMLAGLKGGTITEVNALCDALGLDFAQVAAQASAQARAGIPVPESLGPMSAAAIATVEQGRRDYPQAPDPDERAGDIGVSGASS